MAQAGLHIPAEDGLGAAGVPDGLRRHRRRAVDRREPEHVLVARHEHRGDGSRARDCRRWCCSTSRRRHRPGRGRRARHGGRRSLPRARRARDRDDALRRAEVVRGDDAGGRGGGVRFRSRDVRADLSADLRLAGREPGARDGRAARPAGRRSSPRRAASARPAKRSSPSTSRASTTICRRSTASAATWPQTRLELAARENDLRARDEAVKAREQRAQRKADEALQERAARRPARDRPRRRGRPAPKAGALADAAADPRLVTRRRSAIRRTSQRRALDRRDRRPARRTRARRSTPSSAAAATPATDDAGGRCCRRSRRSPCRSRPASASACRPGSKASSPSVHGKTAEVSVNGKRLKASVADSSSSARPARRRRRRSACTSTSHRGDGRRTST